MNHKIFATITLSLMLHNQVGAMDLKTYPAERFGAVAQISTQLLAAAWRGSVETCTALLDQGAAVNATDCYGDTPLHNAALHGRTDICQLLLERKADPAARNNKGRTPLHKAVEVEHEETVKLLCNAPGAQNNAFDKHGLTALHLSAETSFEISKLLLEAGAHPFMNTKTALYPFDYARRAGRHDIARLMILYTLFVPDPTAQEDQSHQRVQTGLLCIGRSLESADVKDLLLRAQFATEGLQQDLIECTYNHLRRIQDEGTTAALIPVFMRRALWREIFQTTVTKLTEQPLVSLVVTNDELANEYLPEMAKHVARFLGLAVK